MSAVAERLAEIAWRVVEGDFADVGRLVVAMGGRWETTEDGMSTASTSHGVTVGFVPGLDPVAAFVLTAIALLGPLWALVPEAQQAMKLVQRRWSARTKAQRALVRAAPAQQVRA